MSTTFRIQWDFLDGMRGPMCSICKELSELVGSDQDLEQDLASEKALLVWVLVPVKQFRNVLQTLLSVSFEGN